MIMVRVDLTQGDEPCQVRTFGPSAVVRTKGGHPKELKCYRIKTKPQRSGDP
jgi:hypothetical protein